jgi:hypothetical protein
MLGLSWRWEAVLMTATIHLHPAALRHSVAALEAHFSRLGYTVLASGRIERTVARPVEEVEAAWWPWASAPWVKKERGNDR